MGRPPGRSAWRTRWGDAYWRSLVRSLWSQAPTAHEATSSAAHPHLQIRTELLASRLSPVGHAGQRRQSRQHLPIWGDQGHGAAVTADTATLERRRHHGCNGRCPHCMVWVVGDDFAVPEGGVFGFLGPHGAGKTTTIGRNTAAALGIAFGYLAIVRLHPGPAGSGPLHLPPTRHRVTRSTPRSAGVALARLGADPPEISSTGDRLNRIQLCPSNTQPQAGSRSTAARFP
jgi:hypothetical protein